MRAPDMPSGGRWQLVCEEREPPTYTRQGDVISMTHALAVPGGWLVRVWAGEYPPVVTFVANTEASGR